jgi:hypothetical protein
VYTFIEYSGYAHLKDSAVSIFRLASRIHVPLVIDIEKHVAETQFPTCFLNFCISFQCTNNFNIKLQCTTMFAIQSQCTTNIVT